MAHFVRTVSLGDTHHPEPEGLTLSTVHMAKGLEYDVVFIMGANEGVFPDYRAVNESKVNSESPQMVEETHSMFVAITRAKRLCYITFPLSKNTKYGVKPQTASGFLVSVTT